MGRRKRPLGSIPTRTEAQQARFGERRTWVDGHVALLGDACHPMTPYMAQGAASALEDAAVLTRCLRGVTVATLNERLRQYESVRKPRASKIQSTSSANTWMRQPTDPGWVYGYDAWTAPLT